MFGCDALLSLILCTFLFLQNMFTYISSVHTIFYFYYLMCFNFQLVTSLLLRKHQISGWPWYCFIWQTKNIRVIDSLTPYYITIYSTIYRKSLDIFVFYTFYACINLFIILLKNIYTKYCYKKLYAQVYFTNIS